MTFTDMTDTLFSNDDIAVDATYKAGGVGAGSAVRVIVTEGVEIIGAGSSELTQQTTLLDVRASEVSSPDIGDTFTVGATTYRVDNLLAYDGDVYKLSVTA